MRCLLLLTLTLTSTLSLTLPPTIQSDTTSLAPPEPASDTPVADTTTAAAVVDAESTTPMIPADCDPSLGEIQGVFNYTNAPEFKDLSEHQQVFVYEMLAAGEACTLHTFINAETSLRVFMLLEDLPLKYVYLFVSFLSRNLEREGVAVPV